MRGGEAKRLIEADRDVGGQLDQAAAVLPCLLDCPLDHRLAEPPAAVRSRGPDPLDLAPAACDAG
jgi:hypothetical protein